MLSERPLVFVGHSSPDIGSTFSRLAFGPYVFIRVVGHSHFLDFQALYLHAIDNIRKQRDHIVVAHCHVGDDSLQRDLLRRVVLVFSSAAGLKFGAELRHFALLIGRN